MRVVLDTNVLVSGAMVPQGPPGRVVNAWLDKRFDLLTSPELLAELTNVLARTRISRRIRRPGGVAELVRLLKEDAITTSPSDRLDVVRDPDDNRVLEAAIAGGADVVVSGDDDLLSLASYEGVPIVTAVRFRVMLAELGEFGDAEP